jgi:hypothetical protein
MRETLLTALLLGSAFLAVAPASADAPTASATDGGSTTAVTLRVAPTFSEQVAPPTGYVVSSEHWATGSETPIPGTGEELPGVATEAVWLHDPAADTSLNDQPGVAGCTLEFTDSSVRGSAVLDAASDEDCILGWDSIWFDGIGAFVTMVDGLWRTNATADVDPTGYPLGWWQIQVNGFAASDGITDLTLTDGDSLELVYMRHG